MYKKGDFFIKDFDKRIEQIHENFIALRNRTISISLKYCEDKEGFLEALAEAGFYGVVVDEDAAHIPVDLDHIHIPEKLTAESEQSWISYIEMKYDKHKVAIIYGFQNHDSLNRKDFVNQFIRKGKDLKIIALQGEYADILDLREKEMFPQIQNILNNFFGEFNDGVEEELNFDE